MGYVTGSDDSVFTFDEAASIYLIVILNLKVFKHFRYTPRRRLAGNRARIPES